MSRYDTFLKKCRNETPCSSTRLSRKLNPSGRGLPGMAIFDDYRINVVGRTWPSTWEIVRLDPNSDDEWGHPWTVLASGTNPAGQTEQSWRDAFAKLDEILGPVA